MKKNIEPSITDLFLIAIYLGSVLIVFVGLVENGGDTAESLVQAIFWPLKVLDQVIGAYLK